MNEKVLSTLSAIMKAEAGATLIQKITPLAREINCLDVESVARVCVEKIAPLMGMRLASVYLLDDSGHMLRLLSHNHDYPINKIVSLNQKPPTPMVMAVKGRDIVVVEDIDQHKQPLMRPSQRIHASHYFTQNCIIVPLVCQNRVVGVFNMADGVVDSAHGGFDPNIVAAVELFGQLVGASLGNIKLFEHVHQQAMCDGLTGLVNHRAFYDALEKELSRSRRNGEPISLILVDVDNLKVVNDKRGHRAGDRVIKEVSQRISHCVRQVDVAARYGGDEFAVILPNTVLNDAVHVAHRILTTVAGRPAVWEQGSIPLSVSVGVGQYDIHCSPEEIMGKSDEALYEAKKSGKNKVKVFGHISAS